MGQFADYWAVKFDFEGSQRGFDSEGISILIRKATFMYSREVL